MVSDVVDSGSESELPEAEDVLVEVYGSSPSEALSSCALVSDSVEVVGNGEVHGIETYVVIVDVVVVSSWGSSPGSPCRDGGDRPSVWSLSLQWRRVQGVDVLPRHPELGGPAPLCQLEWWGTISGIQCLDVYLVASRVVLGQPLGVDVGEGAPSVDQDPVHLVISDCTWSEETMWVRSVGTYYTVFLGALGSDVSILLTSVTSRSLDRVKVR